MDSNFVNLVLVIIAFKIINTKCDQSKWCYRKCLTESVPRNTHKNINIYLEYKKAVIKVPGPPKIETNRFITLSNGEIIPEVTLRDFLVTPVKDTCSSKNLKATRKKINCKPRPFILEVVSDEGMVIPNKVLTRQCAGYCNGNRICLAVMSKNESLPVQVVQEDGKTQCSTILVPRDIKCKCQCATNEKHCTSNQSYDKKLCSCQCTNEKEKNHCERKIAVYQNRYYWDTKTCSCTCLWESLCTTGTVWDKKLCRCSKKTDNG